MGWNKQSGESWELQRTMQRYGDDPQAKALALKIIGFLTIDDAEKLCWALLEEVYAARQSEGKQPASRLRCRKCGGVIMHGQHRFGSQASGWEHMEGECIVVDGRIDYAPQFDEDDGCPND